LCQIWVGFLNCSINKLISKNSIGSLGTSEWPYSVITVFKFLLCINWVGFSYRNLINIVIKTMKNTTKHWITIFVLSWIIKSTLTYFSFDSYHKDYVLHDESISQRWDKKEQKWLSTSRYRDLSRNPNYQMVKVERKDNFIQHAYRCIFTLKYSF